MVTCGLWMAACDIDNNLTWIPGENPLDANAAIEVELNGVPVYVGWYHDVVINSVVFEQDYVPDSGDLVRVRYNLLGSCDG
jgi:hypothetical protein